MMAGNYVVCPDGVSIDFDSLGRARCMEYGVSQWEIHHTDELIPVDLTPINNLVDALDVLFTFDPELFGIVLFGCVMLFTTGWGTGFVIRLLTKG